MDKTKQLSKHPYHHDPSAFAKAKNFAKITEAQDENHPMKIAFPSSRFYKMGKLGVIVHNEQNQGYFLSVQGRDTYPSWDEIVWIRYNLIPDAAIMALILPNLNSYINNEDNNYKFVFTMEQNGWALDPIPTCEKCGKPLHTLNEWVDGKINFFHADCDSFLHVDPHNWNESHSNGFLAKRDS